MHIKKGNGAIDRNGWTPLRVAVQNPPIDVWNSCFEDFVARIRRPMKADYSRPRTSLITRTSLIKCGSAFDRSAEGPARLEQEHKSLAG